MIATRLSGRGRLVVALIAFGALLTAALMVPEIEADAQPARVEFVSIGRFDSPIEAFTRPGDTRTFVVEKTGRIAVATGGAGDTILDVSSLLTVANEQGLLGAAFHPSEPLLYVHYTDKQEDSVIAEFAVNAATGVADRSTLRTVLTINQPFNNHNAGELAFGPDGYLYIAVGDGGRGGDPNRHALDLSSPLGKILRIDPVAAGASQFTVPADNPFTTDSEADPTIWSIGLRNPWKFSFDSATGDLWIADVGQDEFEEVNFAPATNGRNAGKGLSFGWSAYEANERFNADQPASGHVAPAIAYAHAGRNCSVSGGAVYRGAAMPQYEGWYIYGDFCTGTIWGIDTALGTTGRAGTILGNVPSLAAIAAGGDGELYAVSTNGPVSRLTVTPVRCRGRTATIVASGGPVTGTPGDDVIVGTNGDDEIDGNGGDDLICAFAGDDTVNGGEGRDRVYGGPGDDTLDGGPDIDKIWGDDGADEISGGGGSDRIWAGSGNDTVWAGSGADRVWGGVGDDDLNGQGGQDFMYGGRGNDTMQGNFMSDRLWGQDGNDVIYGARGKDRLYGGSGNDRLFGGFNTDFLSGGLGNDVANGQQGRDNPFVVNVSGCDAETTISC